MDIRLLSEQHLEILSLQGGCTGAPESTHVKMYHIVGNHMPRLVCLRLDNKEIGPVPSFSA